MLKDAEGLGHAYPHSRSLTINTSNRFVAVALLVVASGAVLLAHAGTQAQANTTQDVVITNGATQAVPVKPATGSAFSVAVSNTPNVHAYITNTSAAPVNSFITNAANAPVNAHITDPSVTVKIPDDPAKHIFCQSLPTSFKIPTNYTNAQFTLPPVPSGFRLVITHANFYCYATGSSDAANLGSIATYDGNLNPINSMYFPISPIYASTGVTACSTDCFFPIEVGGTALLSFSRMENNTNSTAPCYVYGSLQGYYESLN